jgi:hypothetical protein
LGLWRGRLSNGVRDRKEEFLRYMGKDNELAAPGGRLAGRHNDGGGIKSLTYPIREVRIKNEITNEVPIREEEL